QTVRMLDYSDASINGETRESLAKSRVTIVFSDLKQLEGPTGPKDPKGMVLDLWNARRRGAVLRRRCSFSAVALVLSVLADWPAMATEYAIAPGQKVIGELRPYAIQQGDVFPDIARRFDIGYTALVAANPGVDPWVPGLGRRITIPSLFILPDAPQQGDNHQLGAMATLLLPARWRSG